MLIKANQVNVGRYSYKHIGCDADRNTGYKHPTHTNLCYDYIHFKVCVSCGGAVNASHCCVNMSHRGHALFSGRCLSSLYCPLDACPKDRLLFRGRTFRLYKGQTTVEIWHNPQPQCLEFWDSFTPCVVTVLVSMSMSTFSNTCTFKDNGYWSYLKYGDPKVVKIASLEVHTCTYWVYKREKKTASRTAP